MKKEYPGSKSSPKRTGKPDTKPGSRKESGGDFSPKTGPKRPSAKSADRETGGGRKESGGDFSSKSSPKRPSAKSFDRETGGGRKESGGDFSPKAGSKRMSAKPADAGAKPTSKKESGGDFSPSMGTKRSSAKPSEPRGGKGAAKPERGATQAFPPKRYINVYFSLGSNMGDRQANLRSAALLIDKNIGKIARKSHVYETEPWGEVKQDSFLNQVIMANTTMDPRDLLEIITEIERELGREKKEKWGPRTIDIDILFYGKRIIRDKGLDIPHADLHKRMFVLVPLMEIAPELEHPVLKQPIDELYMACQDTSEVVKLD